MPLYEVEAASIKGKVIILGRLSEKAQTGDYGIVREDRDMETGDYYGAKAFVTDSETVQLRPFVHCSIVPPSEEYAEVLKRHKVNSSAARGMLRFDKSSSAEGKLILLGFQLPLKVPFKMQRVAGREMMIFFQVQEPQETSQE